MPNSKIQNQFPNVGIKSIIPNSGVSAFQGGVKTAALSSNLIKKGMPIGLLLALTYDRTRISSDVPAVYFGEFRPNIRIN